MWGFWDYSACSALTHHFEFISVCPIRIRADPDSWVFESYSLDLKSKFQVAQGIRILELRLASGNGAQGRGKREGKL